MKPEDAIKYYGSVKALAAATGITHQAVYYWVREKRIPPYWEYKLQELSKGKLKRAIK